MEGRPEGKGKEENSIRASFLRQMPLNRGESFFPGWIRFSGMSVIQNLEDSGKGEVPFFNRACASFPIARFCGGNITWQNPDFSGVPLQRYVLTNLFLSPSFCRMEGL